MNKRILIVEDEASIADNVCYSLKLDGFLPSWVTLGHEAIELHKSESFSLIILDVGLPDISGFEVCKMLREFSDVPILFLTARGEEIDRVVGLEIGGDDYVVKPFSPRELVARVKAITKRLPECVKNQTTTPLFQVDESKRKIVFSNEPLELTSYEFGLLTCLLNQPERVFTREQLMEKVWSAPEESFDRVIDTHIKTIRAKLRAISPTHNPIITHRGVGYSIKLEA